MNTFYINNSQINDNKVQISGEDFHDIKNVLRLKLGEELYICNDVGDRFLSKVEEYHENYVDLQILKKFDESTEAKVDITLIQGLPKQDKMELIIQKCTELRCKLLHTSDYGAIYCQIR